MRIRTISIILTACFFPAYFSQLHAYTYCTYALHVVFFSICFISIHLDYYISIH